MFQSNDGSKKICSSHSLYGTEFGPKNRFVILYAISRLILCAISGVILSPYITISVHNIIVNINFLKFSKIVYLSRAIADTLM